MQSEVPESGRNFESSSDQSVNVGAAALHITDTFFAPPVDAFFDPQMSRFQRILCNSAEERARISHTVELWDAVPKYAISQQAMQQLRTKEGLLPRLERRFFYRGEEYAFKLSAAIIDSDDGGQIAYYPSANEELIEDALRKIACDQHQGFFDQRRCQSGVVFSITMLRKELRARGHARSYQEIIKSLNILAGSPIEIIFPNGRAMAKASFLPFLAVVSRQQWKHDPNAKWVAHFFPAVTQSIAHDAYRQYNYERMMSHTGHLSRWLHKILAHTFLNAHFTAPYKTSFLAMRRDSALLDCRRRNDEVRKLEQTFQELVEHRVLSHYSKHVVRGPRNKIIDIDYLLTPHQEFVAEVKRANKRQTALQEP